MGQNTSPIFQHEVTEFAPKTWHISEFRLVSTFLVEGIERAALIDTGCGIGHLAETVRKLTDKPLIILITHNHFDHDGGVEQFTDSPIYLHEADGERMQQNLALMEKMLGSADLTSMRRAYINSRGPSRYPNQDLQGLLDLVPETASEPIYEYLPLKDGMEFDLGDRVLKIIHTPGHTVGEISILDEKTRTLFSGDTANGSIILARQPNNGNALIEECHRTMEKLWSISDKFDHLSTGHGPATSDKQIIKDYLELTAGLLDGSIVGAYEESGFRKGDVARLGRAEIWYRCDA